MAPFTYRSQLQDNEMRLLKLNWGKPETRLEATLLVRWLDTQQIERSTEDRHVIVTRAEHGPFGRPRAERYCALSYPWESELEEDSAIWLLEEHSEDLPVAFAIRPNLAMALKVFRAKMKHNEQFMFIWVDALCINQNNPDEKSKQIPMMSDIYSHADEVRVWLGPEGDDGNSAIDFLKQLTNFNNTDSLFERPRKSKKRPFEDDLNYQWDGFCTFLKRRWFGRRWVIQEIALARKTVVYCGERTVEWTEFARAVSLFSSRPEHLRKMFKEDSSFYNESDRLGDISQLGASWLATQLASVVTKDGEGRIMEHRMCLESLMSKLTLFDVGDPRDLLYSILWLASDVRPDEHAAAKQLTVRSRPNSPGHSRVTSHHRGEGLRILKDDSLQKQRDTYFDQTASNHERPAEADTSNNEPILSYASHIISTSLTVPNHMRQNLPSPFGEAANSSKISQPSPFLSVDYDDSLEADDAPDDNGATLRAVNALYNAGYCLPLQVDYRKGVYEVCLDFINHVFGRLGYIDMMCRPWAPDPRRSKDPVKALKENKDFDWIPPSWMLTLSDSIAFKRRQSTGFFARVRADPLVGLSGEFGKRIYSASGQTRAFSPQYYHETGVTRYPPSIGTYGNGLFKDLELKGFVLGEVEDCALRASDGNIPQDWLKLVDWDPFNRDQRVPENFWRTIVANRGEDEHSEPPPWFDAACEWSFRQGTPDGGMKTGGILRDGHCPDFPSEFLKRVERVVFHRRLFHCRTPSSEGDIKFLGLGHHDLDKGDLVCVLYGCSVPVVLRRRAKEALLEWKTSTGKKRFEVELPEQAPDSNEIWCRFIGECYVHGMMNGEIFSHKARYRGLKRGTTSIEDQCFRIF